MAPETMESGEVTLEGLDLDPYPIFERLRREAPVYWFEDARAYVLTRWEECERVVSDHETFRSPTYRPTAVRAFGDPTILSADGPLHQDLRQAVDPPLRPRPVNASIDDMVRPVARARAAALAGERETELMASYFEPISVRALGDVLGLTAVDDDTLRHWFFGIVSGLVNEELTEEGFAVSDRIGREIADTLTPIIERLTTSPDESVLSHMVHGGREPGNARTADELMPTLKVYLAGGMQEPGHGAGSTLLGLFSNPPQLARVVADPSLIPRAVVEGLRWMAPIGHTEREAREPVELGGVTVHPGENLYVMLSAANRDPARFERPDEFDLDRPRANHLAFGGGAHFCSGHYFGRAVERIAFEELFAAFPGIAPHPEREPIVRGWAFRAPRELPVLLG